MKSLRSRALDKLTSFVSFNPLFSGKKAGRRKTLPRLAVRLRRFCAN